MPNWKKIIISGSDAALNSLSVTNGITGSLEGTSSYANQALSASFATTASYVNALVQDVVITGSLSVSGSINAVNQIVGNTIAVQTTTYKATLISNALTSSNNYYFPNKQGTLALREDLPQSGSGLTQVIATPDIFKLGGTITENTVFTDNTNTYNFTLNGPNIYLYKASDSSAPNIRLNRASGDASTPLPPSGSQYLGSIGAGGYDTGVLASSAALIFQASENFSTANRGSDIFFTTTPNGTNVPIRRLTIKNNGDVIISGSLQITGSLTSTEGIGPFSKNQTNVNSTNTVRVNESIFNPSNLTILSSSIFIIESNADYYVLGDLINSGSLIVSGTLKIGGVLYNSGSITGPGIIE